MWKQVLSVHDEGPGERDGPKSEQNHPRNRFIKHPEERSVANESIPMLLGFK